MAYIRCPVRPYIPNPLRCFQCQRYGHSKNVCRGQPTCPRCGESDHDSADCKNKEQCLNCKDNSSDSSTPTEPEVIVPSKNNSPPRTKVIAKPISKSPPPVKKKNNSKDRERFAEKTKEPKGSSKGS
ncbi:hypothetical protein TNCV_1509621 [Trichonephila clavipes]|nr:hypothetical protein TNCV_1509621 [Trichonephila clavipes]